jgi:hypothetical protein
MMRKTIGSTLPSSCLWDFECFIFSTNEKARNRAINNRVEMQMNHMTKSKEMHGVTGRENFDYLFFFWWALKAEPWAMAGPVILGFFQKNIDRFGKQKPTANRKALNGRIWSSNVLEQRVDGCFEDLHLQQ